VTQGHLFSI